MKIISLKDEHIDISHQSDNIFHLKSNDGEVEVFNFDYEKSICLAKITDGQEVVNQILPLTNFFDLLWGSPVHQLDEAKYEILEHNKSVSFQFTQKIIIYYSLALKTWSAHETFDFNNQQALDIAREFHRLNSGEKDGEVKHFCR
jgi:hypothetical protein